MMYNGVNDEEKPAEAMTTKTISKEKAEDKQPKGKRKADGREEREGKERKEAKETRPMCVLYKVPKTRPCQVTKIPTSLSKMLMNRIYQPDQPFP
jgi:hypothetical protein